MGVKHRLAIHDEQVLVMTVVQLQTRYPASVRHPLHGGGSEVPAVKIADKPHAFGLRGNTVKVYVVARLFCRVSFSGRRITESAVHVHFDALSFVEAWLELVSPGRFSRFKIASLLAVPTMRKRGLPSTK